MAGLLPDPDISVSFELFPPKAEQGRKRLTDTVDQLADFQPAYFSVTYGAGGTTQDRTREVVDMVGRRTGAPVAHHLTCIGAGKAEVDRLAGDLRDAGIEKIVALRGDIPEGETINPDGYQNAAELVAGLRRVGDFDIAVAAYPEVHPEAASPEADLDHLKRKLDAGASTAITQYAFDTDGILRFIDRARDAGISAPIVPGIMPVSDFEGLKRFSAKCGARIPYWLGAMFEGLDEDPRIRDMVATGVAVEQCRRLVDAGIKEFHIFTLNRAPISLAICRALGVPRTTGRKYAA